jgi:hypothetical protein
MGAKAGWFAKSRIIFAHFSVLWQVLLLARVRRRPWRGSKARAPWGLCPQYTALSSAYCSLVHPRNILIGSPASSHWVLPHVFGIGFDDIIMRAKGGLGPVAPFAFTFDEELNRLFFLPEAESIEVVVIPRMVIDELFRRGAGPPRRRIRLAIAASAPQFALRRRECTIWQKALLRYVTRVVVVCTRLDVLPRFAPVLPAAFTSRVLIFYTLFLLQLERGLLWVGFLCVGEHFFDTFPSALYLLANRTAILVGLLEGHALLLELPDLLRHRR